MATSPDATGGGVPHVMQQALLPPKGEAWAAARSASDLAVDDLKCALSAVSLSPLEAATQAKERENALLEQQVRVQKCTLAPQLDPVADDRLGKHICFGCIIFVPDPRTFRPSQAKWIDGKQSLHVPHIMMVLDYCTGELKTAGGRSNSGETPLRCMNREFIEETGYDSPICHFRDEDLRHREKIRQDWAYTYVKYATFEVAVPPPVSAAAASAEHPQCSTSTFFFSLARLPIATVHFSPTILSTGP
jgi:8-oxo-dGTP pyrophosphatase MutT (NUDIX family)